MIRSMKTKLTHEEYERTYSDLADKLCNELESYTEIQDNDGQKITVHKYKELTDKIIPRIPFIIPTPPFPISKDDLSVELKRKLLEFKKQVKPEEFIQLLKDAIILLFERICPDYSRSMVDDLLWVEII